MRLGIIETIAHQPPYLIHTEDSKSHFNKDVFGEIRQMFGAFPVLSEYSQICLLDCESEDVRFKSNTSHIVLVGFP